MTKNIFAIVACLIVPGFSWSDDRPATCVQCHAAQADQFARSVHEAITCQHCHGGSDAYSLSAELSGLYAKLPPDSTGRPPFDHGSSFTGKASRSKIPNLCGDCHADVARMNPYGLRTDQLAAYWTSGHGKALKQGEQRVAVCTDCHGVHDIPRAGEPTSRTSPANVPDTCGRCHADPDLMAEFDLSVAVVDEYRQSVHGDLLLNQGDTGAPTCATCHGNHAAAPPGFADVKFVCGQCHQYAAKYFSRSIHAGQEGHSGCIQCHGGGPDAHGHRIERITVPPSELVRRYLERTAPGSGADRADLTESLNQAPKRIIERTLDSCTDCHDELDEDESLPKLFDLIDEISVAQNKYAETAAYLDAVGHGVLLVENQRFTFEEAKTHLIALAPLQHTLNLDLVAAKVEELNAVCDRVQTELAGLEDGLQWRYRSLIPIWVFSILFSVALYAKYKALKKQYVKPLPPDARI